MSVPKPIRLLVVDDHHIVRQGLRSILEREPDLVVSGEAASAEEALEMVLRDRPDVVLVDVRMEGMNGIDLCRRLREMAPQVAVVILSSFINEALVRESIEAGARGYLLKDVEDLDLVRSIRSVVRGEAALSPKAAALLLDAMQERRDATNLTSEELMLLRLVARGLTNREIANQLHFSENTVKDRVLELYRKLKVKSRVEAVMEGVRRGLL
jgi:two-component system response regulator DevR